MSNDLGRERDVWRRRVRAAYAEAVAELDAFFDVGHVALRDGNTDGEWDALRDQPQWVRAALHGPAGCSRLAPDLWLEQVRDRISLHTGDDSGRTRADLTLDDAVVCVRALLTRKSLFGPASAVGASRNVMRRAARLLAGDAFEAEQVDLLFADEPSPPSDGFADIRALKNPPLDMTEPLAVTRARALGARVNELEAELERVRFERDMVALELRKGGWGYDRIAGAIGVTKARAQAMTRHIKVIRTDPRLGELEEAF